MEKINLKLLPQHQSNLEAATTILANYFRSLENSDEALFAEFISDDQTGSVDFSREIVLISQMTRLFLLPNLLGLHAHYLSQNNDLPVLSLEFIRILKMFDYLISIENHFGRSNPAHIVYDLTGWKYENSVRSDFVEPLLSIAMDLTRSHTKTILSHLRSPYDLSVFDNYSVYDRSITMNSEIKNINRNPHLRSLTDKKQYFVIISLNQLYRANILISQTKTQNDTFEELKEMIYADTKSIFENLKLSEADIQIIKDSFIFLPSLSSKDHLLSLNQNEIDSANQISRTAYDLTLSEFSDLLD